MELQSFHTATICKIYINVKSIHSLNNSIVNYYFTMWTFSFLNFICPQTISVSVSVLTLSCIAQDRWYAICHPLKFKSTAKRARKSIVLIWVVSCVIMIPQAIVMECNSLLPELLPELTNKTVLFTVCDEHWGGKGHSTQTNNNHVSVLQSCILTWPSMQVWLKLIQLKRIRFIWSFT